VFRSRQAPCSKKNLKKTLNGFCVLEENKKPSCTNNLLKIKKVQTCPEVPQTVSTIGADCEHQQCLQQARKRQQDL